MYTQTSKEKKHIHPDGKDMNISIKHTSHNIVFSLDQSKAMLRLFYMHSIYAIFVFIIKAAAVNDVFSLC